MKKILILLTVLIGLNFAFAINTFGIVVDTEDVQLTSKYKNVILFIGDGMGPNHVDAGGVYLGRNLCFDVTDENWTYHAYSNTDSRTSQAFPLDETKSLIRPDLNNSLYDGTPSPYDPNVSLGTSGDLTTYTDSAAGGTALATGVKVTNSRLALDIDGTKLENLVEIAKDLNKKTGVVTSDEINGATPSSFLVHVPSRHDTEDILKGIATSDADLVLGKASSKYTEKKSTYDTLYKNAGFNVINQKTQISNVGEKMIGVFPGVAPKDDPRIPSLKDLTVFALDYLDNEEGFFLMVEGSGIDKQSHANQTKLMLNELLGFNEAIEAAMQWAEGRDDTLMVVTADHETGGLYYNRTNSNQSNIINNIKWLSSNHSRTRVDIAIYGNIDEYINKFDNNFGTLEGLPYWDNTDVFRLCSWHLTN
jgi:alkaline phosphatase